MQAILSVNGNKAMSYLLQTIFEKEFSFIPVAGVFEAMHIIKSGKKISALIVDVDFQPQQSWELIQHIKSSKLYDVPVIVLATENNDLLKQKTYEYEVDEIFFKPFNPVDLISAVKNVSASQILS
jgi:CheY-like chemotaxis protein